MRNMWDVGCMGCRGCIGYVGYAGREGGQCMSEVCEVYV